MCSEKVVSPSRSYVAVCNKGNFDGHYFRSFKLPEKYKNNAAQASWYFLNRLDGVACLADCFTQEDFAVGAKPADEWLSSLQARDRVVCPMCNSMPCECW